MSRTRGSNSSAENEAFIGGSQGSGVVLLVAVAGCNVGAHVAVRTIERVAGVGVVDRALVFHHVAIAVLFVEHCRPGTCADLQKLFQGWAFWFMVAMTIAMPVTMIIAARLSRHCHYCCKCENQWFESHCRFHGVSPSCLLVGLSVGTF
ncbi:putative Transmembrane protein [Pseudomonas serboccidentalis]